MIRRWRNFNTRIRRRIIESPRQLPAVIPNLIDMAGLRPRRLIQRRGSIKSPPWPQITSTPPPYVPSYFRAYDRFFFTQRARRGSIQSPPWVGLAPVLPSIPPPFLRRLNNKFQWNPRRWVSRPVDLVVPPVQYVVQSGRFRRPLVPHGRIINFIPAAVVAAPSPLVPPITRQRNWLRFLTPRRPKVTQKVWFDPPVSAPLVPSVSSQLSRMRRSSIRRRSISLVVIPQGSSYTVCANIGSIADKARCYLLLNRGLTDPLLMTNADLMYLVLQDPTQNLVIKTDANVGTHLVRFMETLK